VTFRVILWLKRKNFFQPRKFTNYHEKNISVEFLRVDFSLFSTNLIFNLIFLTKRFTKKTSVAKIFSHNQPYYLIKKMNEVIRLVLDGFIATEVLLVNRFVRKN
jgi:hypothetical protein